MKDINMPLIGWDRVLKYKDHPEVGTLWGELRHKIEDPIWREIGSIMFHNIKELCDE